MVDARLSSRLARSALSPFGTLRSQGSSEWQSDHVLHPSLGRFYAEVGPCGQDGSDDPECLVVPSFGNAVRLPSLAGLWRFQEGYRWHGRSGARLTSWPDEWLAVADQGGDPFILDRTGGAILHALHGRGAWEAEPFCAEIFVLAIIVGSMGILHEQAGEELLDEDYEIRPAWRAALRERLAPIVAPARAEATASRLGW